MSDENGPLRRAILLRHGRTAWNRDGRWQGREDVPLDAAGLRQAEWAAELLVRDGSITRLVASPARRASQTATVIAGAFDLAGRPLVRGVDDRLVEIDVGSWTGLTHAETAERDPDLSAALRRGDDVRYGGDGERMSEAAVRVQGAVMAAVAEAAVGDTTLVVTHGAVIRAAVASIVDMPLEASRRWLGPIDNCHWVVLAETGPGSWVIEAWNAGT